MCHMALLDAKFHAFLLDIDENLAAETRARPCRRCGRRLHRDRYPRKPRGGPRNLREAYRHRLSFTCSICDKRHTPASVRFLGRRVYLAVTVVLASAVRTGLTESACPAAVCATSRTEMPRSKLHFGTDHEVLKVPWPRFYHQLPLRELH
jgi:hypothetical protein